jgi:hypothetical protein
MQRGAELILLSESISYTNSGANDVRIIRVKRFRNKCVQLLIGASLLTPAPLFELI